VTTSDHPSAPLADSRRAAQQRADRIAAFRDEVATLAEEGVFALDDEARVRIDAHHRTLVAALAARFDVDLGTGEKQLSWGMRIAALVGALALAASAWYLFYRTWGWMPTAAQVAVLALAPLAGLAATHLAAVRDRSGYFASLAGFVTLACFVLDLVYLPTIFNLPSSPWPLFLWAGLGLLLAFGYGLRFLLACGLVSLVFALVGAIGGLGGGWWVNGYEWAELYLPAALALVALPSLAPVARRPREDFSPIYRLVGALTLFSALLCLGLEAPSYLPWEDETVARIYQTLGFVTAAAAVWLGIRRRWRELVNVGATAFVVFLWVKFVDWWWDWMPKYLFFLLVGLTAVLALLVLRRLRAAAGGAS
jgi:hypothetical protein